MVAVLWVVEGWECSLIPNSAKFPRLADSSHDQRGCGTTPEMHDITTHGAANRTGFYTYLLAKGGSWKPKQNTEDPDRIEQNGRRASGKLSGAYRDSYGFEGVLIDANFDGSLDRITIDGTDYTPKQLKRALPIDLSESSNGSSGSGQHRPDDEPIERGPNVKVEEGTVTRLGGTDSPFSYSTGDFVRYIDPQDGDDSWPGTADNPLKTVQEYVERLPMIARHRTHGITRKGHFNEGAIHFPHFVFKEYDGEKGGFRIGPDCFPGELSRDEREEYVLDARQINTRLIGYSTPQNMSIHDMQLEGAVQNRWGTIGVVGCTLNPRPMGPDNLARAYDCYGGVGFVWFCDVTERAHHVANVAQQGVVALRKTRADDVSKLRSVINLQGADKSGIRDEWGNGLGRFGSWF